MDPCSSSTLAMTIPASFTDSDYILRSATYRYDWGPGDLADHGLPASIDCGAFSYSWFDVDRNAPIDTAIFSVDDSVKQFHVLYTENTFQAGPHRITVKAYALTDSGAAIS